ncbi:substrate-binding periplasmic protein [Paraflavitalea pollutisoli]|uniref:substrate-binding periplasmic protein n=1 Tax=Paraflavitalea pollutisoli TaxID=3034143 RepID=UPI0023ECA8AD|nr:transporter substrate-binding domain-containing protein [Paraflavitalea sp. H1-2-19X]
MAKETIRIGLDQAPPIPLHTSFSGPAFGGYEVELVEQLASTLDLDILYSEAPWPELLRKLEAGDIDAICSAATITTERQQYLRFSAPYLSFHLALVCREDHLITTDHLREHPVGVRIDTTAEEYLLSKLYQPPAFRSDSNDELYNLLLNGVIHGIIDDSPIAQGYIELHPELSIAAMLPGPAHEYAMAFNPNRSDLSDKIDSALQQLQEAGFLHQLQEKWFGRTPL